MYGWIWRRLPGPAAAKALMAAVLAGIVVAVLWYRVFPLLEPLVTLDEVTVTQ
ncbi:hypothetical protein HTZ77_37565 [Nonomuraea sp. SMC257]|uniref:Uncharacterized protein n=1 Tax=Nonomuraea montanisoli TaxID=2741721 RepID=A0A7Y6IF59_9ACTN|nr:hypothetical protein [Nonomuraea montanisoli]NUW37072.1 hypothetical protein [Nonomuraea montanisoli]